MVVISVYTYGVKIIKKFRRESGFLWGVPWNPPLCTNGSAGYLMQLSAKDMQASFETVVIIQVNRFLCLLEVTFFENSKHIFSSDLEYLGLQLVIQITLGKSFANLVLLR